MSNNIEIPEDNESRYNDEGYEGEKFPRALGDNGPSTKGGMTDIICCLIFLLYIAGMVALVVLNMANSKVSSMKHQLDSDGKACGFDAGREDKPYLLMFSFSAPFKSVCVKECPVFDYNQIKYNSDGKNSSKIEPLYFTRFGEVTKDCNFKINF
jgi:choline transporter-like protein 2/4/5